MQGTMDHVNRSGGASFMAALPWDGIPIHLCAVNYWMGSARIRYMLVVGWEVGETYPRFEARTVTPPVLPRGEVRG